MPDVCPYCLLAVRRHKPVYACRVSLQENRLLLRQLPFAPVCAVISATRLSQGLMSGNFTRSQIGYHSWLPSAPRWRKLFLWWRGCKWLSTAAKGCVVMPSKKWLIVFRWLTEEVFRRRWRVIEEKIERIGFKKRLNEIEEELNLTKPSWLYI